MLSLLKQPEARIPRQVETVLGIFFFKVKAWIRTALLGQLGIFAKQMSLLELSLPH